MNIREHKSKLEEMDQFNQIDKKFENLVNGLNKFAKDAENQKLQSELYGIISNVTRTYSRYKDIKVSYWKYLMIKKDACNREGGCDCDE